MTSWVKRGLLLSAALLFACASRADTDNWTSRTFAEDHFAIDFPGEFETKPISVDEKTKSQVVRATNYLRDDGERVFIVGVTHYTITPYFTNGVNASFGQFGCKVTVSDTPLLLENGSGREIRGDNCIDGGYRAETRYYTTGKSFYQVLAIFRKDGGFDGSARRFVESFKVVP